MHEREIREEFGRWAAAGKGASMAREHGDVTRQALDRVTFGLADHVLDVGCGNGWAAREMRNRGAGRSVGMDLTPSMLSEATATGGFSPCVGSVLALPFRDATFTRILSVEAIYYALDLDRAFRELRRVAAAGARLLLVVDLHADNPGSIGWAEVLDVPVHCLSADEYSRRLRAAGFARVETFPIVDRRPIEPEEAFQPSRWFPDHATYRAYREAGALGVEATA